MVKISTVIMLYNEEEVIDEFSARLIKSLEALNRDYEVIFVVEGTDTTLQKVSELAKWNPRVRVEYREKRRGLGKATKKGFWMPQQRPTWSWVVGQKHEGSFKSCPGSREW